MTSRYFEIYSNHNNENDEDDAIVSIASSFDSSIDMSFVLALTGCILLLFVVIIISIVVYRGNSNNNDKSLIVMKNSNRAANAAAAAPRVAVASIRLFKEHVSYLVVIDLMTVLILSLILIKDLSAIVPLDRLSLPSSIFSIYSSVERFLYAVIGLFVLYLFQSASPLLLLILLSAMAFQSATLRVVVGGLLLLLLASALVLYCGRELLANANNTLFISVATVNVAVLLGGASALLNGYQLFGSV